MTVIADRPLVNDKREIFGWTMYDWANSAFFTTVTGVFLGPYVTSVAKAAADASGLVYPLGIPVAYGSFYAYCVSLSVILQVFVLPVLGAIADYSQARKRMMALFTVIGSAACILMFLITDGLYLLGGALLIVSNLSAGAAIVLYNSFLPDIASEDQRDTVSSRGFALGYLGDGILLLINLLMYALMSDKALAARLSLASAGVWWAGFSLVTFRLLRSRGAQRRLPRGDTYLTIGVKQLWSTLKEMRHYPWTLRYLLAYLIYNDGIQTVIAVASIYASVELKLDLSVILVIYLITQLVAIGGALLFNRIAARFGTKNAILLSLALWALVVIFAYAFMQTVVHFAALGAVIGLVLGGSQALSRSLFSQMIPPGREAEFFSFYEISERGTSWMGPLLFGLVNQIYGSMRLGILSLVVFFIIGAIGLFFSDVSRAIQEAGRDAKPVVA